MPPTSGTINITGPAEEMLRARSILHRAQAPCGGRRFDSLKAKAVFAYPMITLENVEMRLGTGVLAAQGTYNQDSTAFDLDLDGQMFRFRCLTALLPPNENIPAITGPCGYDGESYGHQRTAPRPTTSISAVPRAMSFINENVFGVVTFHGYRGQRAERRSDDEFQQTSAGYHGLGEFRR